MADYYNPLDKVVYDGDIARAADLNAINTAVDSAFEQVNTDIETLDTKVDTLSSSSQDWANNDQGDNPDPLQPTSWSSKAYAEEAEAWATGTGGVDTEGDGVTTITRSAREYSEDTQADLLLTNADVAATNADVLLTNADVLLTNADVVSTNADVVSTEAARDKAEDWAEEAEDVEVETGKYSALHWAAKSEEHASNAVQITSATGQAELPVGTTAQRDTPAIGHLRFNSELESAEIYDGVEWGEIGGVVQTSNPNLLINGGFDVWQQSTNYTSTVDGFGGADRWYTRSAMQMQMVTTGDGRNYASIRNTVGTRTVLYITQGIELGNIGAEDVFTVSGIARADVVCDIGINVYFVDTTGDTVTNATTIDIQYPLTDVTPDTWLSFEATFTVPSDPASTNRVMDIRFIATKDTAFADTNYIKFDDLKVERGDTVTPYQHPSYGEELAKCQRYCLKLDDFYWAHTSDNKSTSYGTTLFPVDMRVPPSYTLSGFSDVDSSGDTVSVIGLTHYGIITFNMSSSVPGGSRFIADLLFLAET